MRLLRAIPALSLALGARAALAQTPAECPVDVYQPAVLTQASLSIGKAAQAGATAEAPKALRDAMKFLQDEKKYANNPVGAGFLKGQIFILWLYQTGIGETATYEQLNMKGEKTTKVDLIATADSLFKAVEALAPACFQETLQWRGTKPWTDRINKAYAFLGSNSLDSAAYWADRSATLNPSSPFVHNILAQLAKQRDDIPAMLGHLRAAIIEAKKDTALGETVRQMQFQLASTEQQFAMGKGAGSKAALNAEALALYSTLLNGTPATADGAYAFSSASEIIMLGQDTVAAKVLLAPLVADATPYGDLTLLLAADLARGFGRNDDAMAMYAGALAKNPNIRDANYFLAYMYYEAKMPEKMLPLTERLLIIDPSNGDNYLMRAYAYQLMAATEKDAKKKAELVKQQDALAAQETALSAAHKLLITKFERRIAGADLTGMVENYSKVARAYTVSFEFLDIAGNVVEAMTAQIATVKPSEKGQFELIPTKPGIVAYRYAAIK